MECREIIIYTEEKRGRKEKEPGKSLRWGGVTSETLPVLLRLQTGKLRPSTWKELS